MQLAVAQLRGYHPSRSAGLPLAMVTIFGKDTCPYTRAARDDYARRGVDVEYVNVKASADAMKRMLQHTNGRRDVPVIVDGNDVTIGFGGT